MYAGLCILFILKTIIMSQSAIRMLYWSPRVLCLLAIAFVSLFALDAFDPRLTIWQQIGGFLIHLIPSFVLLAMLVVAWRWEMAGGMLFILVGLVTSYWVYMHNFRMNHSVWMSLGIIAMITIPFIVVGLLFIAHYRTVHRHIGGHAG
jgi:hypothetical protein